MNRTSARIIADSLSPKGHRITSFVLTFPRIINAELLRHRMFSVNSASSRAIPFEKMVQDVQLNGFVPHGWQREHTGMQGHEYLPEELVIGLETDWKQAQKLAIKQATKLHKQKVTKQLTNRLLEPFQYITMLVTATEFENFFLQRCPSYSFGRGSGYRSFDRMYRDFMEGLEMERPVNMSWDQYKRILNNGMAEIHLMELAELMYDAYQTNIPSVLVEGQWHVPFGDQLDRNRVGELVDKLHPIQPASVNWYEGLVDEYCRKIAVARCGRISYNTFDGKDDYEADLALYNRLIKSNHWSPTEHLAQCMDLRQYRAFSHTTPIRKVSTQQQEQIDKDWSSIQHVNSQYHLTEYGWCRNLRGWISHRQQVEL